MGQAPSTQTPISNDSASSDRPALLYNYVNYQSLPFVVEYGSYPILSDIGFPDNGLASIKVAAFTKVTLYEHHNYTGAFITYIGPAEIPDASRIWTSSIKVEKFEPTDSIKIACCNGQQSAKECDPYIAGSGTCAAATLNYCAVNMDKAMCQSWARANQNIADPIVNAFCKINPSSPFCACINSKATGFGINPKCVDKSCLDTGYLTANMQSANCPSIVSCNIYANLQNSGISMAQSIPIEQNCGTSSNPVITPIPVIIPPNSTPNNNVDYSLFILTFIMFIIFILLIAGGTYMFYDDIFGAPKSIIKLV